MPCPFCDGPSCRLDKFPVTEGHALVVSTPHEADFRLLSDADQAWMLWQAMDLADGYESVNIGINIGEAAGQTVPHAHIHVIPRRPGDHPNPRGGVRAVIPGKADY